MPANFHPSVPPPLSLMEHTHSCLAPGQLHAALQTRVRVLHHDAVTADNLHHLASELVRGLALGGGWGYPVDPQGTALLRGAIRGLGGGRFTTSGMCMRALRGSQGM